MTITLFMMAGSIVDPASSLKITSLKTESSCVHFFSSCDITAAQKCLIGFIRQNVCDAVRRTNFMFI